MRVRRGFTVYRGRDALHCDVHAAVGGNLLPERHGFGVLSPAALLAAHGPAGRLSADLRGQARADHQQGGVLHCRRGVARGLRRVDVPLPDLGRGVLAGQRLVRERLGPHDHRIDDPERCRSPAPRIAVLAHVVDVDRRYGRGDVRAGGPAVDGAQQDDALQRGAFDDGQGQLPLPFADHRADPAGGLCGAYRAVDRAAQDGGHELVRRPVPRHVGLRHERILDQERQHRLFQQSGDRHDPDLRDGHGGRPFRADLRHGDGQAQQHLPLAR